MSEKCPKVRKCPNKKPKHHKKQNERCPTRCGIPSQQSSLIRSFRAGAGSGLGPIITSTSPTPVAPLGTLIINGMNFVCAAGPTTVTINGVSAVITSITSTQIMVIVPPGTPPGAATVVVSNACGSASTIIIVAGTPAPGACVLAAPGSSFAVLGGSAVTNTVTPTVVNGNLGVWPGSSITGFPPGTVTPPFAIHQTDAVAMQAQANLTTTYNALNSGPCGATIPGAPAQLGGLTLTSGIYCVTSSAQITGTLTLSGPGIFVFRIPSALNTAAAAMIALIAGANACDVFFTVGTSATLGTANAFQGTILALASITVGTASTVLGRLQASVGNVTLDNNTITLPTCAPCT